MKYLIWLSIFLFLSSCGVQKELTSSQISDNQSFTETSLEGYWRNLDDGLEVHITRLGFGKSGSGSFKDINGILTDAGKFRNIKYIGNNRWSCEVFMHRTTVKYPDAAGEIIWQENIIEMLNMNRMIVGDEIYQRY